MILHKEHNLMLEQESGGFLQEEHSLMLVQKLRDFLQEENSWMLEQDWRNLILVELELHSLVVAKKMFGKV